MLVLPACSLPDEELNNEADDLDKEIGINENRERIAVPRANNEDNRVTMTAEEVGGAKESLIYRVDEAEPLPGEAIDDNSENIPASSAQDSIMGSSGEIPVIEDSVGGPSDTARAEVKLLYIQEDIAKISIEKIINYTRHPNATHPQLKAGDEIEVRIYHFAPSSSDSADSRLEEGSDSVAITMVKVGPVVGEKYLADMSICLTEYGFGCAYDGWSVALYSL